MKPSTLLALGGLAAVLVAAGVLHAADDQRQPVPPPVGSRFNAAPQGGAPSDQPGWPGQSGWGGAAMGRHGRGGPPPEMGPPPPPPMGGPERLKELGVPDDKIEALRTLQYEHELDLIDLRASVGKAELRMQREMEKDDASEKDVLSIVDDLNEARGELFKKEIALQYKVRHLLGMDILRQMQAPPRPPSREGQPPAPAPQNSGQVGQPQP